MKQQALISLLLLMPAFVCAENIIRTPAPILKSLEASPNPPENSYGEDECNPYRLEFNSWIVFTASQEPRHERGKIHSIDYNGNRILYFGSVNTKAEEFESGGYLYFPKSIYRTSSHYIYYRVCRKQIL